MSKSVHNEIRACLYVRTYDVLEVGGAKYTPDRHRGSSLLDGFEDG